MAWRLVAWPLGQRLVPSISQTHTKSDKHVHLPKTNFQLHCISQAQQEVRYFGFCAFWYAVHLTVHLIYVKFTSDLLFITSRNCWFSIAKRFPISCSVEIPKKYIYLYVSPHKQECIIKFSRIASAHTLQVIGYDDHDEILIARVTLRDNSSILQQGWLFLPISSASRRLIRFKVSVLIANVLILYPEDFFVVVEQCTQRKEIHLGTVSPVWVTRCLTNQMHEL